MTKTRTKTRKVGLIVGREWSFPPRFIEAVNARDEGVVADFPAFGGTHHDSALDYAVLIDRISHEVPMYRSVLKHAVVQGVTVVNNPFMWSADDKFLGASLITKLGVVSPKTVVLPNKAYVPGIVPSESLRNLAYPLDWKAIVEHVGLPCILKDAHGGGWKEVHVCRSLEELIHNYNETGLLTMIVQEFVAWDHFVRCICLGQEEILPTQYDPRARKYIVDDNYLAPKLKTRVIKDARTICAAFGYDMNSVEFAVKDGVPYAIDFMNPAPDMDINSLTPPYFEWVVEHMADMAIRLAKNPRKQAEMLGWSQLFPGEPRVTTGAVAAWHALLDGDAGLALDSAALLDAAQRRDGLVFGDRPLCTVLRPRFFTPEDYRTLCDRVAVLMRGFGAAYDRALADPAARAQFLLTEWEEQLVIEDASGIPPSPTTRIDSFLTAGGGLSLTEFNGETPAAPAYNDALADVVADLPMTRAFARDWWVRPLEARRGVLRVLLGAYETWSGSRASPRIAILDWKEVPTASEFVLFQRYFASRGLSCVIGDPRECDYRNRRLWLHGEPVDLVYKRVLIDELVEREGMESPVMRAVRDNTVCFLNGFRSKILHKKASLAVLSDDRNASWFGADVLKAIKAYIPWTRVVEARTTIGPDGGNIDLLEWIAANRTRLVLKPNDAYGGAGIVLGWTVSDGEWQSAVARAVAEPYIVQQKVVIPKESYPSIVDGRVQFIDRQVDTAPFVCDSRYVEGVLTRLSTAELLNVTAGGGSQTPTFLVEPRS